MSEFIDLFFQPFVHNSESYLKDSQNLLQICEKLIFNKKWNKYSCDFESLYTNINTKHAINTITEYFSEKISNSAFTIIGLNEILKLILYNNIFTFDKKYYIQINGLAMGTKCGPTFANIYVYILEKNWLRINKPIIYKRYIDDIFIITESDLISSNFKNIFNNLNLNITCNKEVQFLDLLISDDFYFDKLNFKLFLKKTKTFQYLYFTSNHPKHIFENIPKALFLRIRRICNNYMDYLFFARKLMLQLIKRGYKLENLIRMCLIIGKTQREDLIPYKDKEKNNLQYSYKSFKFIMQFDLNYISLKKDY